MGEGAYGDYDCVIKYFTGCVVRNGEQDCSRYLCLLSPTKITLSTVDVT